MTTNIVIPAKAGTHSAATGMVNTWIPAFAGMTKRGYARLVPMMFGAVFCLTLAAAPAFAVRPGEMLTDPALEARAERVGSELRCLVCRNQSIEDSEADLAHDLRLVVRQRITAGDSDAAVIAYIRARYGDFVLLRPPFETGTALLWGGPGLILLLGGIAVWRFYRRRGPAEPVPLDPDERRRLAVLLGESGER